MNDLYLEYQFTDRAGRYVYNIHEPMAPDRGPVLGQIRMHPDADDNILLEWIEVRPTDREK